MNPTIPLATPPGGSEDIALELCALSRVFKLKRGLFTAPGEIRAVDKVSLRIRKGETLGLVGESGCGKSTLAKMLLGLLPPTSGNVLINGKEVDSSQRRALARHIQPIFQDPYSSLNPRRTVAGIVGVPLVLHKVGSAQEQQRKVREMLDLVGMPERTHNQYPNQLSGGQRQRVAIARSLVLEPTLLLLDEPLGALDLKLREHMKVELKQLQAAFGTTFVYITHDQSEALVLSDHVAVMNAGSFEQVGTPQDLYYQPQTPFVAGFVGANNKLAGSTAAGAEAGSVAAVTTGQGLAMRARAAGRLQANQAVQAFVRPEAISLARDATELPAMHTVYAGEVESLLFDGANSAVLLRETASRTEFRIALPQTGRFADLRIGETVAFSFDPEQAVCFGGA